MDNKRLYLIRIQINYCDENPIDVDLNKEFGTNRVFANWVTKSVMKPKGELLQYVHIGYESIYEAEVVYDVKNGILVKSKTQNYLIKDRNLVFSGLVFLHDTLKTIISKSIDSVSWAAFSIENYSNMVVGFNEKVK
jgi:hypothetical protein